MQVSVFLASLEYTRYLINGGYYNRKKCIEGPGSDSEDDDNDGFSIDAPGGIGGEWMANKQQGKGGQRSAGLLRTTSYLSNGMTGVAPGGVGESMVHIATPFSSNLNSSNSSSNGGIGSVESANRINMGGRHSLSPTALTAAYSGGFSYSSIAHHVIVSPSVLHKAAVVRPTLIICPATMMTQWVQVSRFFHALHSIHKTLVCSTICLLCSVTSHYVFFSLVIYISTSYRNYTLGHLSFAFSYSIRRLLLPLLHRHHPRLPLTPRNTSQDQLQHFNVS